MHNFPFLLHFLLPFVSLPLILPSPPPPSSIFYFLFALLLLFISSSPLHLLSLFTFPDLPLVIASDLHSATFCGTHSPESLIPATDALSSAPQWRNTSQKGDFFRFFSDFFQQKPLNVCLFGE